MCCASPSFLYDVKFCIQQRAAFVFVKKMILNGGRMFLPAAVQLYVLAGTEMPNSSGWKLGQTLSLVPMTEAARRDPMLQEAERDLP